MKINLKKSKLYFYALGIILAVFILNKLNLSLSNSIFIGLFLIALIFFDKEILFNFSKKKRKIKMRKLLLEKYEDIKDKSDKYFESEINNQKILFLYRCETNSGLFNYQNHLDIYLEITSLDDNLLKLCKVHFNWERIDNRDWITKPINFRLRNSIPTLVKNSEKRIEKLISDYENYLKEKTLGNTVYKKLLVLALPMSVALFASF